MQLLLATKTIKNSEKADIRTWELLPKSTKIIQANLPLGKNKIFIGNKDYNVEVKKNSRLFVFKDLNVSDKNSKVLE